MPEPERHWRRSPHQKIGLFSRGARLGRRRPPGSRCCRGGGSPARRQPGRQTHRGSWSRSRISPFSEASFRAEILNLFPPCLGRPLVRQLLFFLWRGGGGAVGKVGSWLDRWFMAHNETNRQHLHLETQCMSGQYG